MIFLYLLVGLLVCTSYDVMPTDALSDLQADPTRPPSGGELAAAVALWCLTVAGWPVAIALRAVFAVRRRIAANWSEDDDEPVIPRITGIPGQRRPSDPVPVPAPREPQQ